MSALSTPIALPSLEFAQIDLERTQVVARSRSPFSMASQRFVHQGQIWRASVTLPIYDRDDAEPWIAVLTDLANGAGTFHLGDPAAPQPQGGWDGSPAVDGASQTGQSLDVKGFTASATDVAKAGDYIQLGSGDNQRLYIVLADADADGSGNATLKIWPRLRESPGDSESIVTANTKGTFEIEGNIQIPRRVPTLSQISFDAVEAI